MATYLGTREHFFTLERADDLVQEAEHAARRQENIPAILAQWDTQMAMAVESLEENEPCRKRRRKAGWQKVATSLICHSSIVPVDRHLRRRLNGFNALRCLLGYRVQRALSILARLRTLTSPRAQAAYIRTICDGWSTKARYQGDGPCRFGCEHGQDPLSHFAYCPRAREWALRHAGLRRPTYGLELDFSCA